MKLATYKDGSRDGQLVVVSRDLSTAHYATGITSRLQQVLDDWGFLAPQLQDLYETLNHGKARHAFAFDPKMCMAPLPRAYQWVDGSAYTHHVELIRGAANQDLPERLGAEPLLSQRASDDFLGPCDDVLCSDESLGIDFGAKVAVITADVPMQTTSDRALESIRLVTLANDVTLRNLASVECAAGQALLRSKPATAFSPVAVTVDELGDSWNEGRIHLILQSTWNGRRVGMCDAGADMTFHFGQLIAHLCKSRNLRAGSLVSGGVVCNRDIETQGKRDWPKGYSSIVDKRATETILNGQPSTEFMKFADTIRIEMKGQDGLSVFGAIEQTIESLTA